MMSHWVVASDSARLRLLDRAKVYACAREGLRSSHRLLGRRYL